MKVKEKAHKDHESGAESSEDLPNSTIEANTLRTRKSSSTEVSAKRRKLDPTSSEEDDEDWKSDQQEKMVLRPRRSISKKAGEAKDRSSNDSTSNKPTPARKNIKSSGQAKKMDGSKSQSVRGSKSHECTVCKKQWSYPAHLEVHMRIHTGEKPFKCDMCGKKFSLSGNLTKHQLLHSGEKPYQCNFCDKKFARSGSLKSHIMYNHIHEKPWKCSRCSKKFVSWGPLKLHLKTHKVMNPCRESYKNNNVNDQTVVQKSTKKRADVVSVTNQLSSLQVHDTADDTNLSRTVSSDIYDDSDVSDSAQISAATNQPSTSKTSIEVQRNAPDVDEQEDQELQTPRDTTADEDSNDASYDVSEQDGSYEEDMDEDVNVDNFADFVKDTGANDSQLKDVSAEAANTLFPSDDYENNMNEQLGNLINVQKEVIRSPLSMDGTENMSHDNNNDLNVASERYSQDDGPDENMSIRSGYIHQHPSNILNVYSSSDRQSMDTLQDVEERASSLVDDFTFDESSGELLEHTNIFETRKRDAVIQQEDNISIRSGPIVRTRVNATENTFRDDIADVKQEPESEGYQEVSKYNGSLRSGPIYRGHLNVSSRSSSIVEDDQESVCALVEEFNVDESTGEFVLDSFKRRRNYPDVTQEDNFSVQSGPIFRTRVNGTGNTICDNIADIKEEIEFEENQEVGQDNGSLRSGPIYREPMNGSVYSFSDTQSRDAVEDDEESVYTLVDESNVDELSDESTEHGNHSFESGPINRVVKEEDNMSFVSGPVVRNDYNDDFNAESESDSRSSFDDATGEENSDAASLSSSDDEVDNQTIYLNSSTKRIIGKYAERELDTLFVVWIEKFDLSVASAVAANSNNCMLIVEKCGSIEFNPNCFPQSVLIDKIIVGNRELRSVRFGRNLLAHQCDTESYEDFEEIEQKLERFAACHSKKLVHIVDKYWNQLIKNCKNPRIISQKFV